MIAGWSTADTDTMRPNETALNNDMTESRLDVSRRPSFEKISFISGDIRDSNVFLSPEVELLGRYGS